MIQYEARERQLHTLSDKTLLYLLCVIVHIHFCFVSGTLSYFRLLLSLTVIYFAGLLRCMEKYGFIQNAI